MPFARDVWGTRRPTQLVAADEVGAVALGEVFGPERAGDGQVDRLAALAREPLERRCRRARPGCSPARRGARSGRAPGPGRRPPRPPLRCEQALALERVRGGARSCSWAGPSRRRARRRRAAARSRRPRRAAPPRGRSPGCRPRPRPYCGTCVPRAQGRLSRGGSASASSVATSATRSRSPALRTPSSSITVQNGQATASVPAPVAPASRTRSSLTAPPRSSIHMCAPPAPQQNVFRPRRAISTGRPTAATSSRGAASTSLWRAR